MVDRNPLPDWSDIIAQRDAELAHLRGAMQAAAMQLEQRLYAAAHQTIMAALARGADR
jgi:hypothetical protein